MILRLGARLVEDEISWIIDMYLGGAVAVGWNVVHKKKRASSVSRATRCSRLVLITHSVSKRRTHEIWVHDTPYMMYRFKL